MSKSNLTETEQFEKILNLNDISDIAPIEQADELQRRIKMLEDERTQLTNDLSMKEKQLQHYKKTQKSLEGMQELQKKKIASLEERLKQSQITRDRQQNERSTDDSRQLEAKIKDCSDQIDKLKKQNVSKKRQLENLTLKYDENQREVETLRQINKGFSNRLEAIKKQLADVRRKEADYQKTIQKLQTSIEQQKRRKLQVKPTSTQIKQIIKTEIIVDRKEIQRLSKEKNILQNQLLQSKTQITSLKKKVGDFQKTKTKMEAQIIEQNKAKEIAKRKRSDLEQTVNRLKSKISQLQRKQEEKIFQPTAIKMNTLQEQQVQDPLDEETQIISKTDKETKKILGEIFQSKSQLSNEDRVKLLNSIIANAQIELEMIAQSSDTSKSYF